MGLTDRELSNQVVDLFPLDNKQILRYTILNDYFNFFHTILVLYIVLQELTKKSKY